MALTGHQRNVLIKTLEGYAYVNLVMLLNSLDRDLTKIASDQNGRLQIAHAVQSRAAEEGWEPALVIEGFNQRPDDPGWAELAHALQSASILSWADEYDANLIQGCSPFIMRDDLRRFLKSFFGESARVLVVRGQKRTGKTYTKEFIYHLRDRLGGFDAYWIELATDRDNAPRRQLTAEDLLMEFLVGFKGIGEPPPIVMTKFTDKKWYDAARLFATWLRGQLADVDEPIWVILDGFNHCDLTKGADELVGELATRVKNDLTTVRLILLGYGGRIPIGVHEEVISRPSSTYSAKPAVLDLLNRLHVGAGHDQDVERLKKLVKDDARDVLKGVEMVPESMGVLGERLQKKAAEIMA